MSAALAAAAGIGVQDRPLRRSPEAMFRTKCSTSAASNPGDRRPPFRPSPMVPPASPKAARRAAGAWRPERDSLPASSRLSSPVLADGEAWPTPPPDGTRTWPGRRTWLGPGRNSNPSSGSKGRPSIHRPSKSAPAMSHIDATSLGSANLSVHRPLFCQPTKVLTQCVHHSNRSRIRLRNRIGGRGKFGKNFGRE